MSGVEIEGLAKSFGAGPVLARVLHGVDLTVAAGDLVAILGASGSGKTTLLRLLSGFERADAGRISVGGVALFGPGLHVAPERRRIGYVAQEGALFPHLSVGDNVLFGLSRAERRDRARAAALLEQVGLPGDYVRRAAQELSGGEQQRVARALAPSPRLVLLDEPFSALDAALRVETRLAVAAALRHAGATALLVTHDQSEALSMGREVAVLRAGRLVQVATPDRLYRQPIDADLARFVGDAVLLPGVAAGGKVACALGRLPLATPIAAGAVDVMLRPEQLRLGSPDDPAAVQAAVGQVVYYGQTASVALALSRTGDRVMASVSGHVVPVFGDVVGVTVEGCVMAYPVARC
jgi:iron(III) transport system ATP-binding protein